MASASPTSLQPIADRPGLDRSETKAYDGSDGKFAGLMAQFAPTAQTLPKAERAHGAYAQRQPAQARRADGTRLASTSGREAPTTSETRPTSTAPRRQVQPQDDGRPAAKQAAKGPDTEPKPEVDAKAQPGQKPQVEAEARPASETEARTGTEPVLSQATQTNPTASEPAPTLTAPFLTEINAATMALSVPAAPLAQPGGSKLAPDLPAATSPLEELLQPLTLPDAPQFTTAAAGSPTLTPGLEVPTDLARALNLAETPSPAANQLLADASTAGAAPESNANAPVLALPTALRLPESALPTQAGPSQAPPVLTFQAVVASEGKSLKGAPKLGAQTLAEPESPLLLATQSEKGAPLAAAPASPLLLQTAPVKAPPATGSVALLSDVLSPGTPGAAVAFVPTQEPIQDLSATKPMQGSTTGPRTADGANHMALSTGPRLLEPLATTGTNPPAPSSVAPTPAAKQVEGSMRWMLRTGAQEAQLQLHPDSLGQVTIHLKVEGGEVHARIWVTDPSSAQAVQEGRAHLEQSLREQGLQLGSFDLQQGNHPSREAPATPSHATGSSTEGLLARQEAPAAPVASILNAHHVELYA